MLYGAEQTALPIGDTPLGDAFDSGWEAGRIDGWAAGYRAGFSAGADVGAARVLIHGPIPDLSPGYVDWRATLDGDPCTDPKCGACKVRRDWLTEHGDDLPGQAG
jgi:hypothetical protein